MDKDFYDDSSDEELLKKQEKEFSGNFNDEDIQELSLKLDVPKHQIVKSLVLHNIGRMALNSPQVDKEYRKRKAEHLPEKTFLKKPSTTDQQGGSKSEVANEISTKDLIGEVVGVEGLFVLGRFLRRSQIRSYKNVNEVENAKPYRERNYRRDQRIDVLATISSKNKKQAIDVHESLVANFNGLAGNSSPNTDMVSLEGESRKGDYSSAYKDNSSNYGRVNVGQVVSAASQLEQNKGLEEAIETIKTLKQEIAKKHPQQDSDVFIAESIRKVCMAEPLSSSLGVDITKRIYALTYLLFKTEVMRSPAALVSHVQMLELIINGEISLDDAFSKLQMPMSASGAIKAARSLERDYDEHLFYQYENPYEYHPSYKNDFKTFPPKTLVQREADLMDKWLKLKFGEQAESIITNPEEHLTEIYQEINRALQSFGVDIRLEAFRRTMIGDNNPKKLIISPEPEIDFNQELQSGRISIDDLKSSFQEALRQDLSNLTDKHCQKLERCLNDDERFVCLVMECGRNNMKFEPNFEEGFAQIYKKDSSLGAGDGSLGAICPIQSISTDHGGFSDQIKNFIAKHDSKNTKMIFSLHGSNHFRTLAVDPLTKTYRYIDSMQDGKNGEVDNEFLKDTLKNLGYSACEYKYTKQQYSTAIEGAITHNNECALHSVFDTIKITQGDDLKRIKFSDLKIASPDLVKISPETARDKLRPFYEEFFENLRNQAKQKQSQSKSPSDEVADIVEEISLKTLETPKSFTKPRNTKSFVKKDSENHI